MTNFALRPVVDALITGARNFVPYRGDTHPASTATEAGEKKTSISPGDSTTWVPPMVSRSVLSQASGERCQRRS